MTDKMKILLFNLGSVEERIDAWGTEGFKSIFEQDVILWGPIPDHVFTYGNKEIPVLSIFHEMSITDVFNKLPQNWIPDVVTCDTSVLNYVPDIYLCPSKTLVFTRDAWADTIYNRALVEFFDFVNYGIVDRSVYNNFKTNLLPLSNCAVTLPESDAVPTVFEKRDIDVLSIANYDSGFYHERYKTMFNVSGLKKSGIAIKFVMGIKRAEINSYYQRSKIVLDWAHTLSNRSFEAALNGCLLFSHQDNPVLKEFWVPWEDYIPYNEDNIHELLSYYLDHPELVKKITSGTYKKVKSIPSSMGQSYWEQINIVYNTNVDIVSRIKRNKQLSVSEINHRLSTPLLYNYNYNTAFPEEWKEIYFKRINVSLESSVEPDERIRSLIEAGKLSLLLNETKLCEKYLSGLEKLLPDYAWLWYLRARLSFIDQKYQDTLEYADRAISCCKKNPGLIKKYILPLNEHNNNCDGRRITDYLWQSALGHKNEFQEKALFFMCWDIKGDILSKQGSSSEAIFAYKEALSYVSIPDCADKLCELCVHSGDYDTINTVYSNAKKNIPYSSSLLLYEAYALLNQNKKKISVKLLREHRDSLRRFLGKRRLLFIKRSINILLIIQFLGKRTMGKSIIKIIEILKHNNHN
jgi:tetratricopeptide (TPR) repeat protein